MTLPPMLAAPHPETRRRWATAEADARRRSLVDRKAEYRAAVLRWMGYGLVNNAEGEDLQLPRPSDFGLTDDQAAACRRAMGKVLMHRADAHGGRIRI